MEIVAERAVIGYGRQDVLHCLNLRWRGGITAVVGPACSGKTTLMRALATLLPPRSGTLQLDGRDVGVAGTARRLRAGIGYLPQDAGLEPAMSVQDHLRYAAWVRGIPPNHQEHHVRLALQDAGLADRAAARARRLTGEERAWVCLACALVGQPRLILIDGVLDGPDGMDSSRLRQILHRHKSATVVLTARERADVRTVADRSVALSSLMPRAAEPVTLGAVR